MIYKKTYDTRFKLPITEDDVRFFRSSGSYGLIHIKIPRKSGGNRAVCGIQLRKTTKSNAPQIVADLCSRCLKGQYNYFEQDLPFELNLWVDFFNDISRNDYEKEIVPLEYDLGDLIEKQLEYEIAAIKTQQEIRQCVHVHLLYLMRYNRIFSLECHNCHEEIIMTSCTCEDAMVIDFVDTNFSGDEINRDGFCINCNGYTLHDLDQYI